MGLAALKKKASAPQVDEDSGAPESAMDAGDFETSTPAAAAPVAAAPVAPVDEHDLSQFKPIADASSSAPAAVASLARPAPGAAPANDLDAHLKRAMAEKGVSSGIEASLAPAAAEASPVVEEAHEAGSALDGADLSHQAEPHGVPPSVVDTSMAEQLLRSSGLDPEISSELARSYMEEVAKTIRPMAAKLDRRQRDEEELMRRYAEMEAAQSVGGSSGLLGGLVSGMASLIAGDPRRRALRRMEGIANDRGKVDDAHNDILASLRERMFTAKSAQYRSRVLEVAGTANAVGRSVVAYNQAVLEADGAQDFRTALEAYAQDKELTVDGAMEKISSGDAPAELVAKLRAAEPTILKDPKVAAASTKIEDAHQELSGMLDRVVGDAETLSKNFPDRFDAENASENVKDVVSRLNDRMPKPVTEEERRKLEDRLKNIAEAISNAFRKLIDRLMALSGIGPKV
jgi:hypothetical protein